MKKANRKGIKQVNLDRASSQMAERITGYRSKRGWSYHDVIRRSEVLTVDALRAWEAAIRFPTNTGLQGLARVFGVTLEKLLAGIETPPPRVAALLREFGAMAVDVPSPPRVVVPPGQRQRRRVICVARCGWRGQRFGAMVSERVEYGQCPKCGDGVVPSDGTET